MIDLGKLSAKVEIDTNKATKELDSFGKSTDKGKKGVSDLGNETKSTSSKINVFGQVLRANLLSKAITTAIKGLANNIKSIGDAFVGIVQKYADYEQLIGGVETLFKDSADKVSKYADEAYKTAGLSANAYMETVTGFSASLLQSLDGDTEKAAAAANQAIIDMSDNANKMGTSMESIQNAYQGFAKQNYTMLDNLKLGYGGTKEEMERLLADAEKLTGVKYDISNLNDVYSAIHVIQTELDITGTTAKEAETTISGSINSLKAAWENLLIGLGRTDSDISKLVSNVVNSAITVVKNVVPVVGQIFVGLKEAVKAGIENIAVNWDTYKESIISKATELGNSMQDKLREGWETIKEHMPEFIKTGGEMLVNFVNGFMEKLPDFLEALPELITEFVNFIAENLPVIIEQGMKIIIAIVKGLIENLPEITVAVGKIIAALCEGIDTLMGSVIESGIAIIKALGQGIKEMASEASNNIKAFVSDNIIKPITDKVSDFKAAGRKIFTAVFDGIKSVWDSIKSWVDEKISWLSDKLSFWRNSKNEMDGSHRTGLNEVPFDGYRAILHKGEMVLTQPEANRYRKDEDKVVQTQPTTIETNVNVEFTGSLAALGRVLQPVIKKEERRIGKALVGGAY